jgi:two-component system cell cycle response regulator DivK
MVLFWEGFMPLGWTLVDEDNIDNLELVRFLLEKAGHQVYCADDGLQGLDMARQLHPDLVLLDITLPATDGWHVVKTLKADPAPQAIKVVALTAHALPGDRRKTIGSGCHGYLSKPLDIANFISDIERYLPA